MHRVPDTIRAIFSKDGATILDLNNGKILRLNFTASLILKELSDGRTQPQIISDLARQFGVAIQLIEADVAEFIRLIEEQKILVPLVERSS